MDVLLVKPASPNPVTRFTRFRTLTLPSVAAEFSSYANVRIIDAEVQPVPTGPFDLVGITCDTTQSPEAYRLADRFRELGVPVVLGGTHPSVMPEEASKHADAIVMGEVEGLGRDLIEDCQAGRLKPRYQSKSSPDLHNVPIAPVDLMPVYDQYFRPYPFELTRGCKNACRFCFNRYIHGAGFRRRNVDDLIDAVKGRPERLLMAMDDNLVNDPGHLGDFAEKLAPLGRKWGGQAGMDIASDKALLRVLKASGFSYVFLGVESFDQDTLKLEAKGGNRVERYKEQIRRLRDYGVMPLAGIILGLDGDGPDVFQRNYEALRDCGILACAFTMPVPFPGTDYHRAMEGEQRILIRDPSLYDGHHVIIRPAKMSVQQLQDGYKQLARRFYSWGAALARYAPYLVGGLNFPRATAALSYFMITKGYRRFHRRLADHMEVHKS